MKTIYNNEQEKQKLILELAPILKKYDCEEIIFIASKGAKENFFTTNAKSPVIIQLAENIVLMIKQFSSIEGIGQIQINKNKIK